VRLFGTRRGTCAGKNYASANLLNRAPAIGSTVVLGPPEPVGQAGSCPHECVQSTRPYGVGVT
jgi:hypothetical protein